MPRFVTGTTWEVQRDVARLQRIRRENNAGRMVAGLGARNVPWAQAHAGPLGADVSGYKGLVSAADQAEFARKQGELFSQRIGSYEGVEARMAQQAAYIQRLQNLNRRSGASGPTGMDAPMKPIKPTLAERLGKKMGLKVTPEGYKLGPFALGKEGFRVRVSVLRSAQRFGGKVLGISALSQAVSGVVNAGAAGVENFRQFEDPVEAVKTGYLATQRGAFELADSIVPMRDIASGLTSLITGGKVSRADARKSMDEVMEDLFTTGEEKARRRKVRDEQLSAAYAEINENVSKMWALVNTTLPQTFALRKNDLSSFRTELARNNEQAIFALSEAQKNQAEKAIEAGDASGG